MLPLLLPTLSLSNLHVENKHFLENSSCIRLHQCKSMLIWKAYQSKRWMWLLCSSNIWYFKGIVKQNSNEDTSTALPQATQRPRKHLLGKSQLVCHVEWQPMEHTMTGARLQADGRRLPTAGTMHLTCNKTAKIRLMAAWKNAGLPHGLSFLFHTTGISEILSAMSWEENWTGARESL